LATANSMTKKRSVSTKIKGLVSSIPTSFAATYRFLTSSGALASVAL
jgi:hypothetical protein